MAAIFNLCQRVIYLKEGRLVEDGTSRDVVGKYLSVMNLMEGKFDLSDPALRWKSIPDSGFTWTRAGVLNSKSGLHATDR